MSFYSTVQKLILVDAHIPNQEYRKQTVPRPTVDRKTFHVGSLTIKYSRSNHAAINQKKECLLR